MRVPNNYSLTHSLTDTLTDIIIYPMLLTHWADNHRQRSSTLHGCKADAKINRKMGNSTPCKIVSPKNFNLTLCTRDYV